MRSKWVIATTVLGGVILTEPAMACADNWVLCQTPDCRIMMQEQLTQCRQIEEIQSDVKELKGMLYDIDDIKRAIEDVKKVIESNDGRVSHDDRRPGADRHER